MFSLALSDISQNNTEMLEKQQQEKQQRHEEEKQLLVQLEEVVKSCWAEHVAQKARNKAEAKAREEAERRRVVEEKEKRKRTLEYFQQLWNEVLEEDTILLEGAERFQIVGPKHKKVPLRDDVDCQPFKKAKGKQLARY